jgi:hypothetical protein
MNLPKGNPTIEDALLIDHLINDEVFIMSMEENLGGKIRRVYADWSTGHLVYELLSGHVQQSLISGIITKLKELNYMKEFEH